MISSGLRSKSTGWVATAGTVLLVLTVACSSLQHEQVVDGSAKTDKAQRDQPITEHTSNGETGEYVEEAIDTDHSSFSGLIALAQIHERMVQEGLPLYLVQVNDVQIKAKDAQLSLQEKDRLWMPTSLDGDSETGRLFTADSRNLPDADLEFYSRHATPFLALAVVSSQDELLAIAPLDEDGKALAPGIGTTGPLFLGSVAHELFIRNYNPLPPIDYCAEAHPYPSSSDALAALTTYFNVLGDRPQLVRAAALDAMDVTVDKILEGSPIFFDAVTGESVAPDPNDVAKQLRSGVAAEDVALRPAVPVGVDLPIDLALGPGGSATEALVFVDLQAKQVLSWIQLSPIWIEDDSGVRQPVYGLLIHITPPAPGNDVAIYVRSLEGNFDCPPSEHELPLLVIPYDDIAGTRRANFDLATHDYSILESTP